MTSSSSSQSDIIIETNQLSMRFPNHQALKNLTIQIPQGQAVGLWGGNGAGKTTLIRCLLGLLDFSGSARVVGLDVKQERKKTLQQIGFVPQEIRFHDDFTVEETFAFYLDLRKVSINDPSLNTLEWSGLKIYAQKAVGHLSGGMRQRLALTIAMIGNPSILFLDEPTANLDTLTRKWFLVFLKQLKAVGKTILFATHRRGEAAELVDRIIHLENGTLINDLPVKNFFHNIDEEGQLRLYFNDFSMAQTAKEVLEKAGYKNLFHRDTLIYIEALSAEKTTILKTLFHRGIELIDFDWRIAA